MIHPTVGRIVHVHTRTRETLAAIITEVHTERMINVCAFTTAGATKSLTSIQLVQPGDEIPDAAYYAIWMPYQVKKDFGSESGEKGAGTVAV